MAEKDISNHSLNLIASLKELSSQIHRIADYCESNFCTNSPNNSPIVETTKEYVSQAVVTVIDHLGTVSASLEHAISTNNAVPKVNSRIDALKQRISKCQCYSEKLALATFQWNSGNSSPRFHCRYIWSPPKENSSMISPASSDPVSFTNGEGTQIPAKKPLFDDLVSKPKNYRNLVLDDVLRSLPQIQQSNFQLHQMKRKAKHGGMKLKGLQNKEIATAIIRRGKRLLA